MTIAAARRAHQIRVDGVHEPGNHLHMCLPHLLNTQSAQVSNYEQVAGSQIPMKQMEGEFSGICLSYFDGLSIGHDKVSSVHCRCATLAAPMHRRIYVA